MADSSERQAELHRWIADTQRNQRRFAKLIAILAGISVGLAIAKPVAGIAGLVLTALIALIGFWITASHIAGWRYKLDELRRRQI